MFGFFSLFRAGLGVTYRSTGVVDFYFYSFPLQYLLEFFFYFDDMMGKLWAALLAGGLRDSEYLHASGLGKARKGGFTGNGQRAILDEHGG